MSRHINTKKEKISKYILISGNPERTKWAAKIFLKNYELVNNNRGALIYSGYYNDLFISFATSGMGMPSMAIYATELFEDYNAEIIIRIGTSGSYKKDIKIFDIINPIKAFSNSSIGKINNHEKNFIKPNYILFNLINEISKEIKINIKNKILYTSDNFYIEKKYEKDIISKYNPDICDMETFILWIIGNKYNKKTASLLLVVDLISKNNIENTKSETSFDERIKKTKECWKLGLETLIEISKKN